MRLNGKFVTQLTESDIVQLVQDRRAEDQNLDFKRDAYGKGDADKKELVKDVLGFANASGGVILVGVSEVGEIADSIPGIALENPKDPMERYERTIRDGTEPMLPGAQISAIPVGQDGKVVVAIGIPASLARPHRAKVAGSGRWTIRRNRNTDDMTYSEIKSAFLDRSSIDQRVREFHAQRCMYVHNWPGQVGYSAHGLLVFHVVPLGTNGSTLDVRRAMALRHLFSPPGESGIAGLKPNLDGVHGSISVGAEKSWWGWVQLYRDGRAEGVMGSYVRLEGQEHDRGRRMLFNHYDFERNVLSAVRGYVEGLVQLGYNPPFAVSVSLLNAHGSVIDRVTPPRSDMLGNSVVTLEPTIIETYEPDSLYAAEMRGVFDQLWNAFGLPACPSYDAGGNWNGRPGPT